MSFNDFGKSLSYYYRSAKVNTTFGVFFLKKGLKSFKNNLQSQSEFLIAAN